MKIAVIVICPPDVLEKANVWGQAGLIADSLWVSSETTGLIDQNKPNDVAAQHIGPGGVHEPTPLALSLAQLGALDEIRVAWVRPPIAEISVSMKSLETLLRGILPADTTRWLDIVVPQERTDETIAPLPGQWLQLRILAEDRAAPDVTDAGWDLDLDVPLHSALVATGILGGTLSRLPWGSQSAADHYEFRAFSRLILGAHDAAAHADRFISEVMPKSSAGDFHPTRFLELDGSSAHNLISDAVAFTTKIDSSALSYNDLDSSQFQPPPRLTFGQHVSLFFRFLGFAFPLLFGRKVKPTAAIRGILDFSDLGYHIEKPIDPTERGAKVPDFVALETEAAAEHQQQLATLKRDLLADPPMPSPRTWRSLVSLATSLNDGGPAPEGWGQILHHNRIPVLDPDSIRSGPVEPVASQVPEIAAAHNTAVALSATAEALRPRNDPLATLADSTGAVVTAQSLVATGNQYDQELLNSQLRELDSSIGHHTGSFLDRLSGHVIGSTLRARLDFERWSKLATEVNEGESLDWTSEARRFRLLTWGGVLICVVLAWFLQVAAATAYVFYPIRVLADPPWWPFFLVLVSIYLMRRLYVFFKFYSAFLERGRRKLEARRRWYERAAHALNEHTRLNAGRIQLSRWARILSALFPPTAPSVTRSKHNVPDSAPKGVAAAMPIYAETEIDSWLANKVAETGWRMKALDALTAAVAPSTSDNPFNHVLNDDGLHGGLLSTLEDRRDDLWAAHVALLRNDAASALQSQFVNDGNRAVKILIPAWRAAQSVTLESFLSEPWPDSPNDDLANWDDHLDFAFPHESNSLIELDTGAKSDVSVVRSRIQLRRVNGAHETPDVAPVSQTFDDDGGTY